MRRTRSTVTCKGSVALLEPALEGLTYYHISSFWRVGNFPLTISLRCWLEQENINELKAQDRAISRYRCSLRNILALARTIQAKWCGANQGKQGIYRQGLSIQYSDYGRIESGLKSPAIACRYPQPKPDCIFGRLQFRFLSACCNG